MGFLANIFAYPFDFLFNTLGLNYLLTLFLFALLMKLILFPFGIKQQKNSLKQAKLRPKEIAIRNKYKGRNDKATQQKLNEEIMRLYQEEHYNPASGCLPMLLQLPILLALYGVITRPITYLSGLSAPALEKVAKVFQDTKATSEIAFLNKMDPAALEAGTFDRLSELKDSFSLGSLDLSVIPSEKWGIYILIPVLTFVFSFLSTKLIRKFSYQPQMNNSNKASMSIMDFLMPLLSVYISVIMPAAIGIYWMFQNILSIAQQYILYKMYPIPEVTEEQIKEAERQLKGKSNGRKNVTLSDDYYDDYDKTPAGDKSKRSRRDGIMSSRKAGISPKVKEMYKNGTRLTARKKI